MAQYKSFYKLLESLADKYNDKTAVLYDTFEVSYRKLFDDSDRKSTRLNSSHYQQSRMPSSA